MTTSIRFARCFAFALLLLTAAPVAAQTPNPEIERATRALAAMWRPTQGELTASSLQAACAGAVEEMAAVEAALPPILTPASLSRVRSLRGLLIIPAEEASGQAYFFPPPDLAWFAPGLGAFTVISEAEGFIGVRDAAGTEIAFQLGRAGGRAVLRIRSPEGAIVPFVGCAPVT